VWKGSMVRKDWRFERHSEEGRRRLESVKKNGMTESRDHMMRE
jgi:hypothetical protein